MKRKEIIKYLEELLSFAKLEDIPDDTYFAGYTDGQIDLLESLIKELKKWKRVI